MGEGGAGLNRDAELAVTTRATPPDDPETIEHDVETTRAELAVLLAELDRRRHEAFDLRLQLRRHRTALGVVALIALGMGASAWLYRHGRRDRALTRAQNLAHALALVSREPEKLVRAMEGRRDPTASIVAALAKIAGAAGQRVVARAI